MHPRDFAQPAVRRAWIRQLLRPDRRGEVERARPGAFRVAIRASPAYRRLCLAHGVTPENSHFLARHPRRPAAALQADPALRPWFRPPAAIYVTSGTTTGRPGRQHLLSTDIYRAVSVEGARRAGLLPTTVELHFLTPSPTEASYSSLSAMFGFWQKALPPKPVRASGFRHGHFEFARSAGNAGAQIKLPAVPSRFAARLSVSFICSTPGPICRRCAFRAEAGCSKPEDSRAAAAKFQGRTLRATGPDFSVRDDAIWNEYGMSELSSQAYARGRTGLHQHAAVGARFGLRSGHGPRSRALESGAWCAGSISPTPTRSWPLQTLDLAERTPRRIPAHRPPAPDGTARLFPGRGRPGQMKTGQR
jgi:hypothetical protein